MDEYTQSQIKEIADKAKDRLKNGYLFGYPVDMNDLDMVIAAAYLTGAGDERRENAEELNRVLSMFGRR